MVDGTGIEERSAGRERAQELLAAYGITNEDLERIRAYGKRVADRIDVFIKSFYTWLAKQREFDRLFSEPGKLERAERLQLVYWEEFFQAQVDGQYIEQRELVGTVHARIGLSLPAYFAG